MCINGPPEAQDLREEADILMQVIAAYHVSSMLILMISLNVLGKILWRI